MPQHEGNWCTVCTVEVYLQTRGKREDDIPPSSACVRKRVPSFVVPRGVVFQSVPIEYFDECVVMEYADARIDAYWLEF